MVKYGLFLGCLIPFRYPSVELAARRVLEALGADFTDVQGYSCCPEPVITRLMDRDLWLTLSARNLALAEKQSIDRLFVLCNGCYETLFEAEEALKDPEEREKVNSVLAEFGYRYEGRVELLHAVEALYRDFKAKIEELVKVPLEAKVAVHYGCHLFRSRPGEDIWSKPNMMRELLEALGAELVNYKLEKLCCGFPSSNVDREFSFKERLAPKLEAITAADADCVVMTCPACISQFETGQMTLKRYGMQFNVPVLHLMEVMAMCFGVKPKELGLEVHRSPVAKFAEEVWG